jgi:hypothetical protein
MGNAEGAGDAETAPRPMTREFAADETASRLQRCSAHPITVDGCRTVGGF